MSTRSAIIRQTEDGTYEGIYCHFDGYLEGVGATLKEYYINPKKVAFLMALGDLSSLAENVMPTRFHSLDNPEKGVTVAYMRDLGETDCEKKIGKTIKSVAKQIENNGYVYVFKDGIWKCNGKKF